MSECFEVVLKVFYVKLYVHSLVGKLKWFYKKTHGATIRFVVSKLHTVKLTLQYFYTLSSV